MSTVLNYKSFFRENDDDDEPQKEYWGEKAAGCIFIAKDTGRILLAHRSNNVDFEPHTWGTWGGKIDGDETPAQAVQREVEEETGLDTPFKISPLYIYRDGNFAYHNYLVVVPFEFTPKLNWENDGSKWVEYGQWPNPLHFGIEALIRHSGTTIQKVIDLLQKKKDSLFKENTEDKPSDNFASWFGSSVVKTSSGKPLVVYHGTNQPVTSFSKARRGMATKASSAKQAYFFTDSSDVASQYAANAGKTMRSDIATYEKKTKQFQKQIDRLEAHARVTGNWEPYEKALEEFEKFDLDTLRNDDIVGQNIIPVFLKMENPLVYDYQGQSGAIQGITDLIDTAKKKGHDGVILQNINDPLPVSNHYAVFSPKQIKSAVGNNGSFDPNDSDITSEAMETPPPAIIQKAEKPASTNVVDAAKMKDAYIVIATLWGEARGEGEQGMHAVMNVLMNRAKGDFRKVRDLCIQHKQFSMWNGISNPESFALKLATAQRDGRMKGADSPMYKKAIQLVDDAMKGQLSDITGGATFYFNPKKVVPKWAKSMTKTKSIGNHDFYKPVPRLKKAQQIKEDTTSFSLEKQGLVDDGIYGYELKSSTSYLRYGYEPSRKVFYLYNIATPSESDQNKGYAKALLEHFFQIIKQSNGALDTGPFTTSGTAYIKHVIERLAKDYKVRLL